MSNFGEEFKDRVEGEADKARGKFDEAADKIKDSKFGEQAGEGVDKAKGKIGEAVDKLKERFGKK